MTQFDLGRAVLRLARSAIAEKFGLPDLEEANHATLQQKCATFVTLRQSGELRGCIGSLHAVRPLRDDVRRNAIAAAFRDPRFAPLAATEFDKTALEVSLLSANERIEVAHEQDLVACLRPGIDGLILQYGVHRATLLPQVWRELEDPREFLAALKRKAGLPGEFWSTSIVVSRYAVTTWKEQECALTGPQQ
jgi:uncharacterized protein